MAELDLIRGLTQTVRDAESPQVTLERMMARRKGGSTRLTNDAMDRLRDALEVEGNTEVRDRISTALALLEGRDPKE